MVPERFTSSAGIFVTHERRVICIYLLPW
jgi:hypothetical protein